MKIRLQFSQDMPAGPVLLSLPKPPPATMRAFALRDPAGNAAGSGQILEQNHAAVLLPPVCANEPLVLDLVPREASPSAIDVRQEPHRIAITLAGQPFAVFRYEPEMSKPIVWPLVGPDGLALTRAWPMSEEDSAESRDHIHHQSFWVAHGDVNSVDFWTVEKGHGMQQVRDVRLIRGPACAVVDARIDWVSAQCVKQMSERRRLVFWDQVGGLRFVDLTCLFEMTEGDVRFGDTKEGGICSLRVAPAIEEQRGAGRITTGAGAQGETAAWGKPAPWCDYSGPLAGRPVGLAVLDHPSNFRHPATWHVRAYGLMTANPFGISYFTNDKTQDGSFTWRKGDAVEYRYRVVLHSGDAAAAGIDAQWGLFAASPAIEVF